MEILFEALSVLAIAFASLMWIWVYRSWNQRHEDIKEALACIDDLQARVRSLEERLG